MSSQVLIAWRTATHERVNRSPDWFWALGIVSLTGSVTAFLLDNILLGLIVLIGAFSILLTTIKPPRLCDVRITEEGIQIDHSLFPYRSLVSFWIDENKNQLVIGTRSMLNPQLVLPLETNRDSERIRTILRKFLPEEEQYETIFDRIVDSLGL